MNRQELFYQTNAFAMQYSVIFGVLWAVGVFSFIFHFQIPFLMLIFFFSILSTPFIGIRLTKMFRNQVSSDGSMSFGRAYLFSLLLYLYASILLALFIYLYFEFMDNGMFCDNYEAFLSSPEVQKELAKPDMQQTFGTLLGGNDISVIITLLRNTSAIAKAAGFLDSTLFIGFVLSLPTALVCKKCGRKS